MFYVEVKNGMTKEERIMKIVWEFSKRTTDFLFLEDIDEIKLRQNLREAIEKSIVKKIFQK